MSPALDLVRTEVGRLPESAGLPARALPFPWRDPHTVSKAELAVHITALEKSCTENPGSADLRTCLGMAYAMNYEVYKSMDMLEDAVALDATHFYAQIKYAELFYRLRALPKAEEESLKALNLARDGRELAMARTLLQEIRRLIRDGSQKPAWTKPLRNPTLALLGLMLALSALTVWLR